MASTRLTHSIQTVFARSWLLWHVSHLSRRVACLQDTEEPQDQPRQNAKAGTGPQYEQDLRWALQALVLQLHGASPSG